MRPRLLCVCAWLAWGCGAVAAALDCGHRRAETAGGGAAHRRCKRYLVFPEGSSIGVTVVWGVSYDLNTPDVWFLTGDITTVYELPDRYIRKKLFVNNKPTTPAAAVHEHHHHPDFVLKSHKYSDFHYPLKHQEFHNDFYVGNNKEQKFAYGYSESGHETQHFAKYFHAYPRKRKQWERLRFQRHLWERKNWHNQLQILLKEMPQIQGWSDETPKMCEVAKASCAISFLNPEVEG